MLNNNVKDTIQELKQEAGKSPPDIDANTTTGLCVPIEGGTETPPTIADVLKAVRCIGEKRDYVIKIILAVYASTFMEKSNPLWLLLVGNPSSNKTTLVDLIAPDNHVYRLDTMTSNPFSSGQREKEKPKDLLPLLDGKCFVMKEYAALFGRSDEMVKQLISDLVAIYDGEYSKHSPTRGTIRYKSFFSHIGCVTPMALSSRQGYMSAVGARFLFLRIESLSDDERNDSMGDIFKGVPAKSKQEVAEVICGYCNLIRELVETSEPPKIGDDIEKRLKSFANLTSRARGIVLTNAVSYEGDDGKKRIHYEVDDIQIEEPFRAVKQVKKLAECLAFVNVHKVVGMQELEIVKRVVLSSMPVRRADILRVFESGSLFTVKEAADKLDKNNKTVRRNLDELVSLKVLDCVKKEGEGAKAYFMKEDFAEALGFGLYRKDEPVPDRKQDFSTDDNLPF